MIPLDEPVRGKEPAQAVPSRAVAPVRASRLATVCADLALDPRYRLSEQERALLGGLIDGLIDDIADLLRFAHPDAPVNDGAAILLPRLLASAGLDPDPELVALALRRTDEERLAAIATARAGRREARLLQTLVSHDDGAVAAAAMALVLARGRRRDRLGRPLILLDDLPAQLARRVVNRVAAVLSVTSGSAVSAQWTEAVDKVMERHDDRRGISVLICELVETLDRSGSLDDALFSSAAEQGEVAIMAEALARRSGLTEDRVIDALLSGDCGLVAAILRLSACDRALAATLLAVGGDLIELDDPARAMAEFDQLDDAQLGRARAWLVADDEFVAAVDRLGGRDGQRHG